MDPLEPVGEARQQILGHEPAHLDLGPLGLGAVAAQLVALDGLVFLADPGVAVDRRGVAGAQRILDPPRPTQASASSRSATRPCERAASAASRASAALRGGPCAGGLGVEARERPARLRDHAERRTVSERARRTRAASPPIAAGAGPRAGPPARRGRPRARSRAAPAAPPRRRAGGRASAPAPRTVPAGSRSARWSARRSRRRARRCRASRCPRARSGACAAAPPARPARSRRVSTSSRPRAMRARTAAAVRAASRRTAASPRRRRASATATSCAAAAVRGGPALAAGHQQVDAAGHRIGHAGGGPAARRHGAGQAGELGIVPGEVVAARAARRGTPPRAGRWSRSR